MSAAFKRIEKSLKDAIAFAEGRNVQARVYKPLQVDVKRVRKNIGMTQIQFSARAMRSSTPSRTRVPV